MKTVIYFFSGTGNTFAVAKRLAAELGEADILQVSVLAENKNIPVKYDYVGFAAPSYYSHVPPYVIECMTDIIFSEHQKVFSIITCGGNRGAATHDIRQKINAAGKEVMLEYRFILPGSYILSYGAFPHWYQKLSTAFSYRAVHKAANDIMI